MSDDGPFSQPGRLVATFLTSTLGTTLVGALLGSGCSVASDSLRCQAWASTLPSIKGAIGFLCAGLLATLIWALTDVADNIWKARRQDAEGDSSLPKLESHRQPPTTQHLHLTDAVPTGSPEPWPARLDRLERAYRHLMNLVNEVEEFLSSAPYEIVRSEDGGKPESSTLHVEWRLRVLREPPQRWARVFGYAATNLRDALDDALRLRLASGARAEERQPSARFPIADLETEFDALVSDFVGNVDQETVAILREHQPKFDLNSLPRTDLRAVRNYSDLARQLKVTIVPYGAIRLHVDTDASTTVFTQRLGLARFVDGAVVGSLDYAQTTAPSEITATPEAYYSVGVRDTDTDSPLPMVLTLTRMFRSTLLAVEALLRDSALPSENGKLEAYLKSVTTLMEAASVASAAPVDVDVFLRAPLGNHKKTDRAALREVLGPIVETESGDR